MKEFNFANKNPSYYGTLGINPIFFKDWFGLESWEDRVMGIGTYQTIHDGDVSATMFIADDATMFMPHGELMRTCADLVKLLYIRKYCKPDMEDIK